MDGGSGGQNGGAVEAGVSERINGSHYLVLTVWPGHRVMDEMWQVMVPLQPPPEQTEMMNSDQPSLVNISDFIWFLWSE